MNDDSKSKVSFLYYMEPKIEQYWQDGLWSALQILAKDYIIDFVNLFHRPHLDIDESDFVLGWGAWHSPADNALHRIRLDHPQLPTGLCIAGNAAEPFMPNDHSVLFYETNWYKCEIEDHKNTVHAFGVNRDIHTKLKKPVFEPLRGSPPSKNDQDSLKIWDFVSVGSFSLWKRHQKLIDVDGKRLAIGQIQKNNLAESFSIISDLVVNGVGVSDMVEPQSLAVIYNLADTVYIPANIDGGGERSVLEARSCGINVKVEDDNPKLQELLNGPIWGAEYYADQLRKGIQSCL